MTSGEIALQELKSDLAANQRVGDERHEATIRDLDQIKASIQRVHDRLDGLVAKHETVELQVRANVSRLAELESQQKRLDRLADAVETLTSKTFWAKVGTGLAVAATIGSQLVKLIGMAT